MDISELIGIGLIILIATLIFLDRKNIEVQNKIIFLRRTKKLNDIVEKVALRYSKILNILGLVAIFSVFVSFSIFLYAVFYQLTTPINVAPVQVVLPSLPGLCSSSFILCVPAYFWFLIIPIIAISHELAHALLASSNRIKVKSMGYAFLLVLPAFFVELDEKKLKKADLKTKLKIYSAGSFGNFLVALFAYLILLLINFIIISNFGGVKYEIIENSPAFYSNLTGIILKINDIEINDVNDLIRVSKTFNPNQTITIHTTTGIYNITLDENAKIGIKNIQNAYYPKNLFAEKVLSGAIQFFIVFREFLFWLFLLNIGIGMFNLLPIKPLDGGLFFEELLKNRFKKRGEMIFNFLSFFTIFLIVILIIKFILKF
ncbi:MAG: site-2 protease family protein [Candidatus Aenigmatarchaeota archaeon]